MPNLNSVRSELINQYFSTSDSLERYKILHEVEELIKELRKNTIDNLDYLKNCSNMEIEANIFERILTVTAIQAELSYESVVSYITPSSSIKDLFNDLNFDSLDMVEIIMAYEYEFDICITDDEAEGFGNVQDIINLVTKNTVKI